jgi:uncharacterized phiE125 gp8 family phage protein
MTLSFVSGPPREPFDVALLRQWMKLSFTDDDALILSLMRSARRLIEAYSGVIIFAQSWRFTLDYWPMDRQITLPLRPVSKILEAQVTSSNGESLSVISDLWPEAEGRSLRVSEKIAQPGVERAGIQLLLSFGADSSDDIDPVLRNALFNLVTHHYFNRGDEEKSLIPASILRELDLLRDRRLI